MVMFLRVLVLGEFDSFSFPFLDQVETDLHLKVFRRPDDLPYLLLYHPYAVPADLLLSQLSPFLLCFLPDFDHLFYFHCHHLCFVF